MIADILLPLGVVFATSLTLGLVLTPIAARVGARYGIVDRPRDGELQNALLPRVGGYALTVAYLAGIGVSFLLFERFPDEQRRIMGLLLGSLAILPLAIFDDLRRLSAPPQLVAQIGIAIVAAFFGSTIATVSNPLGPAPFGSQIVLPTLLVMPVTVFWLVAIVNTVNWLDTMDGLAAGVGAIAAAVFLALSVSLGQKSIAALPAALLGACLGFIPYNFNPARIILGTSGSMMIGYGLGVIAIIGGAKIAATVLVLGIPIIDAGLVIWQRSRSGRSPLRGGDSAHLPHRLYNRGLSQRRIALLLYALCAVFGSLSLWLVRVEKLFAFMGLLLTLAVLALFVRLRTPQTPDR